MEDHVRIFEFLADEAYRQFAPLAASYYYTFKRHSVTSGSTPCMVFLGNHSSGKSTLINWVLGGAPVQEMGLAPTDDGFTAIIYGEEEEDICGPAALSRLPEEFRPLETYGGTFLQHLKVKVRNRKLLKTVMLIDSPGMIDSAEGTVSRTYDFEGVVRLLAEVCDMIFFLLDPDKPGTTGETVSVFAKCLAGVEFKLRVMLNKCDAFSSMYDFARTYGTTCWNLARALRTKDLPKIWTVYSGEERKASESKFDFSDFNRHREEFLKVLNDAAARRMDNVFSQANNDFLGLSIRMRIVNHAARSILKFRAAYTAGAGLFTLLFGIVTWNLLSGQAGCGAFLSGLVTAMTAGFSVFSSVWLSRFAVRLFRGNLSRHVDEIFEKEYRKELAVGTHDNIRQLWDQYRNTTEDVVRDAPLALPLLGEHQRHRLDAAAAKILKAFHDAK